MALLLPGFPSTLFSAKGQQQHQPLLSLKPSQIKVPFSLSFSPLNHTLNRSSLLSPVFSATQQQQQSTLQNPSTESQQQQQQQQQQNQEPIPDPTRLIAQNIPWTSTAEDIRSLFERFGTVTDVELSMYNKIKNRGLAFVTMGSEEEAFAALSNLDSYELDGRVMKVEFSRSLKKRPSESLDSVKKYNVFVGNLTWRVRSSDLRELFGAANDSFLQAEVVFQSNPRRSAGYGFVSFASKEEAEAAIATYNGKKLMGRSVRLVLSKKDITSFEGELKDGNQLQGETVKVNSDEGLANKADDDCKKVSTEAE